MGTSSSRIGLSIANRLVAFGHPASGLLEVARLAEASGGLESIWVGDSLLAKPRLEALTLLGALADCTRRVRLGILCMASFPLREPTLLAIQLASIDHLSSGRLVVGVCLGPGQQGGPAAIAELEAFDVRSVERVARLERGIVGLRELWGQSGSPQQGPADPPRRIAIAPLQKRLPILLAATPAENDEAEQRVVSRVAQLADGWQTDAMPAPRVERLWRSMQAAAKELGRADRLGEAVVHVPICIAEQRTAAEQTAVEFIGRNAGTPPSLTRLPAAGAFGPPGLVVELLGKYLEIGVTPVARLASFEQRQQLEWLVRDVLPQLG